MSFQSFREIARLFTWVAGLTSLLLSSACGDSVPDRLRGARGTPGPTAVPCNGIDLSGEMGLQAAVETEPNGTTFCLRGTFLLSQAISLKPRQEIIGPATLRPQSASHQHDGLVTSSGNLLEGLDISGFRIGVRVLGDGVTIRHNRIHNNARSGIGGPGNETLIEGNEIFQNGSSEYFRCCAAGIKYVGMNVIVRDNFLHDNTQGVWADQDANHTLIANNDVTRSQFSGIFVEISAAAIIRHNVVWDNNQRGAALNGGIRIGSSQDVRVFENELGGNKTYGILVAQNLAREPARDVIVIDNELNGDSLGGCDISDCSDNV